MAPRSWTVLAATLLLVPLAGCTAPAGSASPPTLTVQGPGAAVTLRPFSYCWQSGCADGVPSETLPSVGAGDRVKVSGSEIGLRFSAQFSAAGNECARVQSVLLGTMGSALTLWPAGPAGTYQVVLGVEGAPGHTASYSFEWTTTRDGVWPVPAASASVLADNDGALTSYGVELDVENLAVTPRQASATIEVTSREGITTALTPARALPSEGCDPVGSVRFRSPEATAQEAVESGSAPFRYEATLVLDGRRFVGTATWPDDQRPDALPSMGLSFRSQLPGLPQR